MAAVEKAYGVGIAFVDGFIYQFVACAYFLVVETFPNQVDGFRCFFELFGGRLTDIIDTLKKKSRQIADSSLS